MHTEGSDFKAERVSFLVFNDTKALKALKGGEKD